MTARINRLVRANIRFVAGTLAVVMTLGVLQVVHHVSHSTQRYSASPVGGAVAGGAQPESPAPPGTSAAPLITSSTSARDVPAGEFGAPPGTYVPGKGTVPFGIHGNHIKIVYYWKGDRSGASPYLGASGQKGQLDEADAFNRFIAYINKHPNGDRTFMGFRFDLHGWVLDPVVVDAGQYPETYSAAAEKIVKEDQPFAAISSHGGLSDYMCPALAKAHIFNPVTYDVSPGLVRSSGGWCLPQGLSWEKEVGLSVAWLSKQAKTPYQSATGPVPRVYGILYAEYPGLADAIPALRARLEAAGVRIKSTYSVPEGLADSATPASDTVDKFKADGVNTIIDPDAGAPITFTHAAAGKGYQPDYFVWPCSGEDAAGQVRLYDPAQWARASGLSCFDDNWNLDLTLDSNARRTQWFTQYEEIAGNGQDPPSTSPLVYAGILPVLAGITNAGRDLTVERFFAGLKLFHGYRYNAITGLTADPSHFLLTGDAPDGSQIGDVAEVTWSATTTTPGNATAGAYIYSKKRYAPGASF